MSLSGWVLNPKSSIKYWRDKKRKEMEGEESTMWRRRQRLILYSHKPLNSGRGKKEFLLSLQREWPCWHLDFGLLWFGFHNCERINFCCLHPKSMVMCYSSPRKLPHEGSGEGELSALAKVHGPPSPSSFMTHSFLPSAPSSLHCSLRSCLVIPGACQCILT